MSDALPPRADFAPGAAIKAGLIAGLVFVIMEMLLVGITAGTPFGPPRMIAAIAMGEGVLPPPASFDLVVLIVALIVHFALSVLLALIFCWLVTKLGLAGPTAILAGVLFGLIVYFIHFYGFTAVFPWFAMARNWITIVSHLVFGGVLAWAYLPRHARVR